MKVEILIGSPGLSRWNIVFEEPFPMRAGRFPKQHPCWENPRPTVFGDEPETPDPLGRFRGRGYASASCFPDGDGISFIPRAGTGIETVKRDVAECFGVEIWRVR